MIESQFFPRSKATPDRLKEILNVFSIGEGLITSDSHYLESNEVLRALRPGLEALSIKVETGKTSNCQIQVPVLFGKNCTIDKSFSADAYDPESKTVIEVEAGRAVSNHQFLKDLFEACVMHDVDHLVIAVRKNYRGSPDFDKVFNFVDTLYTSGRLTLPLKGILIIGY